MQAPDVDEPYIHVHFTAVLTAMKFDTFLLNRLAN